MKAMKKTLDDMHDEQTNFIETISERMATLEIKQHNDSIDMSLAAKLSKMRYDYLEGKLNYLTNYR